MFLIVKHLFFPDTFFFFPHLKTITRKGEKTDKRPNKLLFFKEYCVCLQIWYCLGVQESMSISTCLRSKVSFSQTVYKFYIFFQLIENCTCVLTGPKEFAALWSCLGQWRVSGLYFFVVWFSFGTNIISLMFLSGCLIIFNSALKTGCVKEYSITQF